MPDQWLDRHGSHLGSATVQCVEGLVLHVSGQTASKPPIFWCSMPVRVCAISLHGPSRYEGCCVVIQAEALMTHGQFRSVNIALLEVDRCCAPQLQVQSSTLPRSPGLT